MSKRDAANQALLAALDSWNWRPPPNPDAVPSVESAAARGLRTESSVTVFSGDLPEWVRYLSLGAEHRCEPNMVVRVHVQAELRLLVFEPENEDSRWLAEILNSSFRRLSKRVEDKSHVARALNQLLFEGKAPRLPTTLRLSPDVPSDGTRESDREEEVTEVRLVLHSRLTRYVREALESHGDSSGEQRLGFAWPLISLVVSELAYPESPRDRFAEKVRVFAKMTYIALNVLYDGRKAGELQAGAAGAVYESMVSASSGIARDKLAERHPYFRLLNRLGFMLRAEPYGHYVEDAEMAAREYLDSLYLRLSLAGAMPGIAPVMQPMSFERKGRKVFSERPQVGRFGILDRDDLDAWKTVADPFRDLGFTLLRQVGMGEFGRVYEALNDNSPNYPARVALKVDRIVGKKKRAILEAEAAMAVGRHLARALHIIRLYDTGKLKGQRYTYHVLQLIDGDTLDNLVGVTGNEHASVTRPPRARQSDREGSEEYERAVSSRGSELWRRQRMTLPFQHTLSTVTVLDLLTSVLLWLEDVHRIGYAINDLKNGNLMMSRRGQLKGIDLDSYAPVHSPRDKVTDYMFLAVSMILLLFSAPVANRGYHTPWEQLIESEERLRRGLSEAWPFGDIERLSAGRVSGEELSDVLIDLIHRSRHLSYTKDPDRFSADIGRLISIKRRLLLEEMVID
ncbi:MAG: hypothetical protein ACOY0T_08750 [Myxococcota bacterium]